MNDIKEPPGKQGGDVVGKCEGCGPFHGVRMTDWGDEEPGVRWGRAGAE